MIEQQLKLKILIILVFVAKGEVIVFEGFMKVYIESKDDNDGTEKKGVLPSLKVGEVIKLVEANASEFFHDHRLDIQKLV